MRKKKRGFELTKADAGRSEDDEDEQYGGDDADEVGRIDGAAGVAFLVVEDAAADLPVLEFPATGGGTDALLLLQLCVEHDAKFVTVAAVDHRRQQVHRTSALVLPSWPAGVNEVGVSFTLLLTFYPFFY